ncbi:YfjI family protein [Bradyrhizobium liaoningense]|uniref:YfjI family protein n=1 Tax=Bradyrhizobium liaoningense TaxID=43992 RepID=UPI003908874F
MPWPAVMPIKSVLPPVEKLIPELLPDALRDYVFDVADRQQAPPDFAAVTALCGLAAVSGNRVRISPKQNDDWVIVPNLWGAIVGRPSAMKSPAMQAALGPIYSIQDELREKWEEEIQAADIDDALSGLDAKDAKKKAEKALKGGDRKAARDILASLIDRGDPPPCPRIVVNDTTVEKLGELLNENPRGLLLIRDELPGFLARLESQEHQSERAFYLESFNGDGRFTFDRIGRGTVHIENCTVSIVGGVQPSRIAPIVRGAMTGTSNDGLIQRLQMTVWPDDIGSWQWVDRNPDLPARLAYEKAFREIYDLGMGDTNQPAMLRFSPESQALFQQWMTEIQVEARSGSLPSTLESHILKMPKTVATLALLFELVDGGRFEVNEVAMRRALGWADYLRSHANRLYSAGETMAADGARLILERRRQLPEPFTARDIQRKGWASLGDKDAVTSVIEMLIETHNCREAPPVVNKTGGRPSVSYIWNPNLKEEG